MSKRDYYEDYEWEIIREVNQQPEADLNNGREIKYVYFVSRSKGRKPNGEQIKRKKAKDVEFVSVDGNYVLPVSRNEIRPSTKHPWASHPDNLAEEVLGSGASGSQLLEVVKTRFLRKKGLI